MQVNGKQRCRAGKQNLAFSVFQRGQDDTFPFITEIGFQYVVAQDETTAFISVRLCFSGFGTGKMYCGLHRVNGQHGGSTEYKLVKEFHIFMYNKVWANKATELGRVCQIFPVCQ